MKNNFLLRWLFLVFLFTAISACGDLGTISTPTETAVPIGTQTPRPTAVVPTATSTPVTTSWANEACWEKRSLENADENITGSLFYLDLQSNEYRLLNLATKKTNGTNLFQKNLVDVQVSPYGQYFSFLRTNNNEFLLFSEDGGKIFSIPPKTYFSKFLNNSQILLGHEDTDDELYVLNPESGKLKSVFVAKPDFSEKSCWANGFRCFYRYAAYSPDLKYVFYIAADRATNHLLDFSSEQLVENKAGGYSFGNTMSFPDYPFWKLDASAVTIFDSHNYYNIEVDGDYYQLTHFENLFPNSSYGLVMGKWSPSGRYLAFMILDSNVNLYIFDSYTNTLINPCLSETHDGRHFYWPMFWSPEGDQLALDIGGTGMMVPYGEGYQFVRDEWYKTEIVDLDRQLIYEVPNTVRNEQQILLGWLSWELP